jgi:MFS family permease
MASDRLRQVSNLVFAIGQAVAPAITPLIGLPFVGAISDRYPTYVVPAGYAFSIWSLIFALSIAYAVWQLLPAQRENPLLRRVGWLTAAAFAASMAWEFVFPAGLYALSVAVIVITLVSLAAAVGRMAGWRTPLTSAERWLVWIACGLYLGWITVATVANVAQTLTSYGVMELGLDAETWGMVMLIAAAAIAAAVTLATRNAGYPLAVIWALLAVFVARRAPPVVTQSDTVAYVALGAAAVVAAALLAVVMRGRRNGVGSRMGMR